MNILKVVVDKSVDVFDKSEKNLDGINIRLRDDFLKLKFMKIMKIN